MRDKDERLSIILNQLDHFLSNHPWTEDYATGSDGELFVTFTFDGIERTYGFQVREIG